MVVRPTKVRINEVEMQDSIYDPFEAATDEITYLEAFETGQGVTVDIPKGFGYQHFFGIDFDTTQQ